jgi:hypothetical protein
MWRDTGIYCNPYSFTMTLRKKPATPMRRSEKLIRISPNHCCDVVLLVVDGCCDVANSSGPRLHPSIFPSQRVTGQSFLQEKIDMIADRELTDFVELLQNLNVANNVIRTSAERHYEMLKITPESFLPLKLLSVSTREREESGYWRLQDLHPFSFHRLSLSQVLKTTFED